MKKLLSLALLLLVAACDPPLPAYGASSSGVVSQQFLQLGTGAKARTFLDKARDYVSVKDYGAKCDGTDPSGGTDDSDAFIKALAAVGASGPAKGKALYVPYSKPSGICVITKPLTVPNNIEVIFERGAAIYYTDTLTAGSYLFTNGIADTRGGGVHFQNVRIVLRSVTAKGIDLLNSIASTFDNLYIEGYFPAAAWAAADNAGKIALLSGRTNVGVRIRTSPGTDSFFNVFNFLYANHVHTAVLCEAGSISTQMVFNYVALFGGSVSGDNSSVGFDVRSCNYSVVNAGYVEAYYAGAAAGFKFTGSIGGWRINDVVFDHGIDSSNIFGGGVVAIPMNAVSFGVASRATEVRGGTFTSAQLIVDSAPASAGNFVEAHPGTAAAFTATLAPVGGSITLTSGVGGDKCYALRRAAEAEVFCYLQVASVSSPTGRLFVNGLPFTARNDDSLYVPVSIWATGLDATAKPLQGLVTRNTASIEVTGFDAGASTTNAATYIKAGSQLMIHARYIAAPL